MAYLSINNVHMYYDEHGTPNGTPMVLLHGFSSYGGFWEPQIPVFGARYRLIVPDLRGHGRSDNPDGTGAMNHRQFARDVIELCRTLGIERAVFCGESTGAMLQLSLGLQAPGLPIALVLAGGTYALPPQLRASFRAQTPETWTTPERRRELAQIHTAMGPDHWRFVVDAFLAQGHRVDADDYPTLEELRALTAPVLIVHGDRDHFFPVAIPTTLFGTLPNAELCILPNTNHRPPRERPAWFNDIVLDFLQQRDETAAHVR
jgi:pimeloyl-ACP methyl ester carboxylesterase